MINNNQLFHAKQEQHQHDQTPLHPSSSTTTTTSSEPQPPRRPVIIYTHSPKVIHTHPRDFMALVQKLTGYTPPPPQEETQQQQPQQRATNTMDDNESTSVVTEEHGTSVNSCFIDGVPYRAPSGGGGGGSGYDPYLINHHPTQVFSNNPNNNNVDYLSHHHQLPFYNPDSMFMNSSLRVLKEYPDHL